MTVLFRTAGDADLAAAGNVLRAAFDPYVRRLGRHLGSDAHEKLPAVAARGDLFVAERGGRIVGVVETTRTVRDLYIDAIGVDPACQGQGLGRWLLQRIEAHALTLGVDSMSLDTAEMMEHLIALYESHGFVIVERRLPKHGKDPHLRVLMRKRLTPR